MRQCNHRKIKPVSKVSRSVWPFLTSPSAVPSLVATRPLPFFPPAGIGTRSQRPPWPLNDRLGTSIISLPIQVPFLPLQLTFLHQPALRSSPFACPQARGRGPENQHPASGPPRRRIFAPYRSRSARRSSLANRSFDDPLRPTTRYHRTHTPIQSSLREGTNATGTITNSSTHSRWQSTTPLRLSVGQQRSRA